jgi:Zn-dependent protease with chaperone function
MPFLLLLFLILACLPDEWAKPWAPSWAPLSTPALSATLTWLGVAVVAAFARATAAGVVRRLAADPARRERVLRRYGRLRTYHVLVLLGVYALSLYAFGWGWTVQQFCGHGASEWPGTELFILAPFVAALVLSWVFFYDAERALHETAEPEPGESSEPFWSRGSYVGFHLRQNLALVFAPLLLMLLMKGARRFLPDNDESPWAYATSLGGIALFLVVFIGMPWLLRLVLGLKPLPPGPLRDRLETTSGRLGFRCGDILVWNTRGGVANAMVAGVVPWVRYVLLTDRLMSELTPDEVEAVFGHEVGHVKHHHMIYYLAFIIVSVGLVGGLWNWLATDVGLLKQADATLQALPLVLMLGAYIFVVFGFLSRRCERQADLYGCRAVSCAHADCRGHAAGVELAPGGRGLCPTGIRTFIDALEKVARLNGISRDKPGWLSSWQHSTIARRVAFLQEVLLDQSLERRFQRRVALVKWGLFLGLLAGVVGVMLLSLFYNEEKARQPLVGAAALSGEPESSPSPLGGEGLGVREVTPRTAARTDLSE